MTTRAFCGDCHLHTDHPKYYVAPGRHECRGLYTSNGTTWSDVKAWVDEGDFWCDECCLRYLVPPPPRTEHAPWCPRGDTLDPTTPRTRSTPP